jgi:hypothetical protein
VPDTSPPSLPGIRTAKLPAYQSIFNGTFCLALAPLGKIINRAPARDPTSTRGVGVLHSGVRKRTSDRKNSLSILGDMIVAFPLAGTSMPVATATAAGIDRPSERAAPSSELRRHLAEFMNATGEGRPAGIAVRRAGHVLRRLSQHMTGLQTTI